MMAPIAAIEYDNIHYILAQKEWDAFFLHQEFLFEIIEQSAKCVKLQFKQSKKAELLIFIEGYTDQSLYKPQANHKVCFNIKSK